MQRYRYRNIFLIFIFLLSILEANAFDNLEGDTILYREDASRVVITQIEDGINVTVPGEGSVKEYNYQLLREKYFKRCSEEAKTNFLYRSHSLFSFPTSHPQKYWSIGIDGITLGLSSANGQPTPKGLQWSKSIEIGWLSVVNIRYNFYRSSISLGLGFDWRNYRISTSDRFLSEGLDGDLKWEKYPEEIIGKWSRLKIFSLQFPLLYEYAIPRSAVTIKAGGILNLNTHSSLRREEEDRAGIKTEYSSDFSSQRLLTVDLFANISLFRLVGIYVRYSPMRVLKKSEGINFHPFTIGISMGI